MGTGVSDIHGYPLRPRGFEEPLFPTRESRLAVAEHLLGAPWLMRASEIGGREATPVELRRVVRGVEVAVPRRRGARRWTEWRLVAEVLGRWREVREWWAEGGGVDRFVFRVLLCGHDPSGGTVADLTREHGACGGWSLVGVAD